jgi:hypothetical protein
VCLLAIRILPLPQLVILCASSRPSPDKETLPEASVSNCVCDEELQGVPCRPYVVDFIQYSSVFLIFASGFNVR